MSIATSEPFAPCSPDVARAGLLDHIVAVLAED
jgi:hypothetical protein